MDVLPDFLVVGASKSGTTSLHHYLKQHPQIFLSDIQKEGRYFSQMTGNYKGPGDKIIDASITRDINAYKALFNGYKNEKVVGDISPEYIYFHEKAIPLIKKTLGKQVKIIVILRSPVERAFSAYTHFKRDKRETLSFEEALEKEDERKTKKWVWAWQYKNSGLYFQQVKAYTDNFPNVRVIIFEDFKKEPQNVLAEICEFLEVSPGFKFDTSYKYNVSGEPKSRVLYKFETSRGFVNFIKKFIPAKLVEKMKKNLTGEKQMVKPEMNPETRKALVDFFKDDILQLQNLINKDLSHWLQS
ncbi:MAG: sulfotransferase [Prolixibacteraceae bacterium]|nr:sulfotransferase [Prolixibacteraceae bacterium]